MNRQKIIDRLGWYYPVERFNAVMFAGVTGYVAVSFPLSDTVFLLHGLVLMTLVLFQGQHYWKLKRNRLMGKPVDQTKSLALFKQSKQVNLVLIGLIPVALLGQLVLSNWAIESGSLFLWAIAANVFGVLEHINYFSVQLMIDTESDLTYVLRYRRLKTASLKKDMQDNEL